VCIWKDCAATFANDLPPAWNWLLTYYAPRPEIDRTLLEIDMSPFCTLDVVLCPKHMAGPYGRMKDTSMLRDVKGSGLM
jgi:hypothetical protein